MEGPTESAIRSPPPRRVGAPRSASQTPPFHLAPSGEPRRLSTPGHGRRSILSRVSNAPPPAQLQWPPLLSLRSEAWVTGLAGVTAICGSFISVLHGPRQIADVIATVVSVVLGVCIVAARRERQRYLAAVDTSRATRIGERWQLITRDRIGVLLLQVGKVVNTDDPADRRNLAASARASILALASADAIGAQGGGVRMNLFRLNGDRTQMTPEDFGSTGRSGVSTWVFGLDDETMTATLQGESRFVHNTYAELGQAEASQLEYETFATTPVGAPNGTIWGVLTVDAPKTGDLDRHRDMPLMNVFAGLIAVTYACECYAKPRR